MPGGTLDHCMGGDEVPEQYRHSTGSLASENSAVTSELTITQETVLVHALWSRGLQALVCALRG